MPTRSTRTSTPRPLGTSSTLGFFNSARCTESGLPGITAMAFIAFFPPYYVLICRDSGDCLSRREVLFSTLLNKLGHEAGPAGLMVRADTGAAVPVEVFVEEHQLLPMGIGLKLFDLAKHWPTIV